MAASHSYREFVLEQLGRVTPVAGKSMSGGVGIYARGLFFALIAEGRLYFKVNDATRPDFERQGMEPFRPFGEDRAMGYYDVPADVVEDGAGFWVRFFMVTVELKQVLDRNCHKLPNHIRSTRPSRTTNKENGHEF